jgi:hypothetical protein
VKIREDTKHEKKLRVQDEKRAVEKLCVGTREEGGAEKKVKVALRWCTRKKQESMLV